MKIAIVGSRDFANLNMVAEYVESLPEDTVIISGGARGVERTVEFAAHKRGLVFVLVKANWTVHEKAAGYRRNHVIVDLADKVVAFWDGTSRGTAHSIECARKAAKPVEIRYAGEEMSREELDNG